MRDVTRLGSRYVSDVALGDCGCEPCDAVGVLEQHKSSLAAAGRIQASVTLSP